jgi:hypothetical protein
VGTDAYFSVDEKMANTDGACDPASRLDAGKNRHFDLAVKLLLETRWTVLLAG